MKLVCVLACWVLALGTTVQGSVIPTKASLSFKDKLALELPLKHLEEGEKPTVKNQLVKVQFPQKPTTTTASPSTITTTTTTTTTTPQPQRPKYIDAAVFRHQFTAPATSSPTAGKTTATAIITSGGRGGALEQKSESLIQDSRTALPESPKSSSSSSSSSSATSTTTTTTTTTTTEAPSHDYEGYFSAWEDISPFHGELRIMGGDDYSIGYRPLGY